MEMWKFVVVMAVLLAALQGQNVAGDGGSFYGRRLAGCPSLACPQIVCIQGNNVTCKVNPSGASLPCSCCGAQCVAGVSECYHHSSNGTEYCGF